ncbi:MAG: hypothetical protein RL273_1371, partial [Bacteroidota bacterium]
LYEMPNRKMAVSDIDLKGASIYKNVFNFIDGAEPYVLHVSPNPGANSFYFGRGSTVGIDIFLPNRPFAEYTYAHLLKVFRGEIPGNPSNSAKPERNEGLEICQAAIAFLDELQKGNFATYLGDPLVGEQGYDHWSLIDFPHALKTHIGGKEGSRYAQVVIMEEWGDVAPREEMLAKYDQICKILKICLEDQKFGYQNLDAEEDGLKSYSTHFSRLREGSSTILAHGLFAVVRIVPSKTPSGTLKNTLTITFSRR